MSFPGIPFGRREGRWPRWIELQLARRGITDERVLRAFARVRREDFVPARYRGRAYEDGPLPIGCQQTISQPYIVALSLQALELDGGERVLDVGTGSGYQAALLSHLAAEVFTIEIHRELYFQAGMAIQQNAGGPVHQRHGDGSLGWPEEAPFDAIVSAAHSTRMPKTLLSQLRVGGRMVVPVGGRTVQGLYRLTKRPDGKLDRRFLERVMFVPLVGKEGSGYLPR